MAKTAADIRSLARTHTDTAIRTLAKIMVEPKAPAAARVAAANSLLDRGWGKATQMMEVAMRRVASEIGDDELAAIASGCSAGTAEAPDDPSQPD